MNVIIYVYFLQKNNAIAVVDIRRREITDLVPLGYKDHNITGSGFDGSDRDEGNYSLPPITVVC